MNLAAAAAALALAAAAPFSELGRAAGHRRLDHASRALAAAAGVLLLVAAVRPAARPAAVLAFVAAAVFPRGLPCLAAAAAAAVAAVRPAPEAAPASIGAWMLVAALALGLAAAALQDMAETSGSAPKKLAAPRAAAVSGALVVLTLMLVDGGHILHWGYGLGAGATRLELPGAALVLGLALLVTLAGSLSMGAHLLARSPDGSRASRMGQSLLVLGAGLGALGVAVVAGQGLSRNEAALAAGAVDVAAMLIAVGVLGLALIRLLAASPAGEAAGVRALSGGERMLRLAAAAAMLAAATAGVESWQAEGTYVTAALAEAASVALLGLVAVQPTRLRLARTALFVVALLALLARGG